MDISKLRDSSGSPEALAACLQGTIRVRTTVFFFVIFTFLPYKLTPSAQTGSWYVSFSSFPPDFTGLS
jgi:hypothetical protein